MVITQSSHETRLSDIAKTVWGNVTLRFIFLLLFLCSATSSIVVPILSVFAVQQLGSSILQLSSYFAVNAACGMVIVLVVGQMSDNVLERRVYISISLLLMVVGYILLSFASEFWHMSVIGIVFISSMSVASSQLFALAREVMIAAGNEESHAAITSFLRMAYSFGWVTGPAVGGMLLSILAPRGIFRVSSFLATTAVLITIVTLPKSARLTGAGSIGNLKDFWGSFNRRLVAFSCAVMFILCGDVFRISILPLFVTDDLGISERSLGFVFSITPFAELFAIPIAGILAEKFGSAYVVASGALVGCVYHAGIALSTSTWQIYILQFAYAYVVAAVIGVGISYAQYLGGSKVGAATGAYFSAQNASVILGSVMAGVIAELLSVRYSFALPSGFSLVGFLVVIGLIFGDRFVTPTPQRSDA